MEDANARAERISRAVAEGLNLLGVLLCGPAFRKARPDVHQLLNEWDQEYAAAFRDLGVALQKARRVQFESAVEALSAVARAAADADHPVELARVRAMSRNLMAAMGFVAPELTPEESAVCELHGSSCPMLGDEAG